MARVKFKTFGSERYKVVVMSATEWLVECQISLSTTSMFTDMKEYARLKRVYRRNRENFDLQCNLMEFRNLFNYERVK